MTDPGFDLDDAESVLRADAHGRLHTAAGAGAQVRAVAAAIADRHPALPDGGDTRALVVVTDRGPAARAAAVFLAVAADSCAVPLIGAPVVPGWVGALDVVLVLGDDAGDPDLARAVDAAVGRGAHTVVTIPEEGPVGAAGAGRAHWLPPRVPGQGARPVFHHLAVALAVAGAVCPRQHAALAAAGGLTAIADALDAEAMRSGPGREVFRNPAKTLAGRVDAGPVVLAGHDQAGLAVAEYGAAALYTAGQISAAAVTVAEALAAPRTAPATESIFFDPQFDAPTVIDPLVLVQSTAAQAVALRARTEMLPRAETVVAGDEPEPAADGPAAAELDDVPAVVQWLVLMARWDAAAAYAAMLRTGKGE